MGEVLGNVPSVTGLGFGNVPSVTGFVPPSVTGFVPTGFVPFIAQRTLSQGWKEYLQYIPSHILNAQQGSLGNSLGGIPLRSFGLVNGTLLGGYWDYFGDFTNYILNNVCQSTACN